MKKEGWEFNFQSFKRTHETEFFLYNVDTFLLVGDVSLDRRQNTRVDDFL